MNEARQQVLQMLQDGKLTAAQAHELLQAMESSETADSATSNAETAVTGDIIHPDPPPDMSYYRRFWQIPFFVGCLLVLASGLVLRSIYQSSGGAISFGFICAWTTFLFMFLLTTLAFMSRRSAWVHVRVNERGGRRIAISLPLPLQLAGWGVNIARHFVKEEERHKTEMAASFLAEARRNWQNGAADPLVIHVDDEDGDKVQVYIG